MIDLNNDTGERVVHDDPVVAESAFEQLWQQRFVVPFNHKYPTLPLYDTRSAKFYVRRAVRFLLTGSVDGPFPEPESSESVSTQLDVARLAREATNKIITWIDHATPHTTNNSLTNDPLVQAELDSIIESVLTGYQNELLQLVRETAELGCLRGRQIHCAEREQNSADWCVACKAKYVLFK